MTENSTTTAYVTTTATRPTTAELEHIYRVACDNAETAWKSQSITTVEEGFTLDQAIHAINQARQVRSPAATLTPCCNWHMPPNMNLTRWPSSTGRMNGPTTTSPTRYLATCAVTSLPIASGF